MRLSKDYINSAFAGCECIAVIDGQHFKGDIEIYELQKMDRRKFVGAWYPDMALMTWPIAWFWQLEEKGEVRPPPDDPRNGKLMLTSEGKWEVRRKSLYGGDKRRPLIKRRALLPKRRKLRRR